MFVYSELIVHYSVQLVDHEFVCVVVVGDFDDNVVGDALGDDFVDDFVDDVVVENSEDDFVENVVVDECVDDIVVCVVELWTYSGCQNYPTT